VIPIEHVTTLKKYPRPPTHPCVSVAVTVKKLWPADVAVPDNTPLDDNVKPEGSEPDLTDYMACAGCFWNMAPLLPAHSTKAMRDVRG